MSIRRQLTLLFFILVALSGARAQHAGIKTNLVGDATLNVNLGAEVGLAPKWSLDVTGQINFWTVNNHRWRHWLAQPEARYWFCERFAGHFLGVHAIGGQYNIGAFDGKVKFLGTDLRNLKDRRYQGWGAGLGIGYGYDWVLNKHWNFEAELGIGWIYSRFDVFSCVNCGAKLESDKPHHYFGPTKLALNLVYLF